MRHTRIADVPPAQRNISSAPSHSITPPPDTLRQQPSTRNSSPLVSSHIIQPFPSFPPSVPLDMISTRRRPSVRDHRRSSKNASLHADIHDPSQTPFQGSSNIDVGNDVCVRVSKNGSKNRSRNGSRNVSGNESGNANGNGNGNESGNGNRSGSGSGSGSRVSVERSRKHHRRHSRSRRRRSRCHDDVLSPTLNTPDAPVAPPTLDTLDTPDTPPTLPNPNPNPNLNPNSLLSSLLSRPPRPNHNHNHHHNNNNNNNNQSHNRQRKSGGSASPTSLRAVEGDNGASDASSTTSTHRPQSSLEHLPRQARKAHDAHEADEADEAHEAHEGGPRVGYEEKALAVGIGGTGGSGVGSFALRFRMAGSCDPLPLSLPSPLPLPSLQYSDAAPPSRSNDDESHYIRTPIQYAWDNKNGKNNHNNNNRNTDANDDDDSLLVPCGVTGEFPQVLSPLRRGSAPRDPVGENFSPYSPRSAMDESLASLHASEEGAACSDTDIPQWDPQPCASCCADYSDRESWRRRRPRRHAFQWPMDSLQITAIGVTTANVVLFCSSVIPAYAILYNSGIGFTEAVVTPLIASLAMLCMYAAWLTVSFYKNGDTEGEGEHCGYCHRYTNLRSRHCKSCNKCVSGFDHHCKWLNVCIGEKNYRVFIFYIVSTLVALVAVFLSTVLMLSRRWEELARFSLYFRIGPLVLCVLVLLTIVPLAHLIIFHVMLHWLGLTTYDYLMMKRGSPKPQQSERGDQNGGLSTGVTDDHYQ